MRWEHVLWDENKVYVPELVAKRTRRAAGNKREYLLCDAMRHWLEPYRRASSRIVDMTEPTFRARMTALFKQRELRSLITDCESPLSVITSRSAPRLASC